MVASSWTLAINPEDNSLDTQYPAGDKPDRPIEDFPDPVKDLVATATGTSSIELTWTPVIGVTTYNIQGSEDNISWTESLAVSGPPYTAVNLQPSTQYWARIYTENENGLGPASNTATATTDTPETPEPGDKIMFDDFNRYNIGQPMEGVIPPIAEPGVKWMWNSGTPVTVGSGGRDGGNCLHFNYKDSRDPNDNTGTSTHSYCEQHLKLCSSRATAHQEIWVEFWLMTTDVPRTQSKNDKFMAIQNVHYSDGGAPAYGRQAGFFNTWGENVKHCTVTFANYDQNGDKYDGAWTHPYDSGGSPPYGPGHSGSYENWYTNWNHSAQFNAGGSQQMAITAGQAGTWVRYRTHYKCNDPGVANGIMRHWRNDFLLAEGIQIERYFMDGYNKSDGLYLMGYVNAGFTRDTVWKVDQVSVWATDPGWTF